MELIQQLVSQLGISSEQAEGGAGLLFSALKKNLAGEEFTQITETVPDVQDLVERAPSGGLGGMLGNLASNVGAGDLGRLASLAGGFSKLGLDSEMISKFVPIVLSFIQSKGGDALKGIVEKALT